MYFLSNFSEKIIKSSQFQIYLHVTGYRIRFYFF